MKKPWNVTCPNCQDTCAYQGFLTCECPNYSCKYYTETQKDLVNQYQKYIDSLEADLKDTVPGGGYEYDENGYYVSNTYVSKDDDDTNQIPTVPYGTTYAHGYSNSTNDPTDPYDLTGYYSTQNQSLNNDPGDADSFCGDDDLADLFGIQ